jgi:hypothetical protein
VRGTYALGASLYVAYGIVLAFAGGFLGVAGETWTTLFVVVSLVAGFQLAGTILLPQQPFLWSVLVAAMQTLGMALAALGGRVSWTQLGWTIALWSCVAPMTRVKRLMRAHPDTYFAHVIAGTSARRAALKRRGFSSADDQAALLEHARVRAMRTAIVTCGVWFVACGAGLWWSSSHPLDASGRRTAAPTPFRDAVEQFETAWKTADVETLGDLFADADRAVNRGELRGGLARRGWTSALPAIRSRDTDDDGARARLDIALDDGLVHTAWIFEHERWWMETLAFPRPPLEPFAQELARAWNSGSADEIVSLASKERSASFRRAYDELAAQRGWQGGRPTLGPWKTEPMDSDRAELRCAMAGTTLVVGCRIDDGGRWRTESLRVEGG